MRGERTFLLNSPPFLLYYLQVEWAKRLFQKLLLTNVCIKILNQRKMLYMEKKNISLESEMLIIRKKMYEKNKITFYLKLCLHLFYKFNNSFQILKELKIF